MSEQHNDKKQPARILVVGDGSIPASLLEQLASEAVKVELLPSATKPFKYEPRIVPHDETHEPESLPSSTGRSVEERYGHVRMALDGLYQSSWHRPIRPSDFFPIMRFLGELVPDNPIEAGIAEWEKSDMQSATGDTAIRDAIMGKDIYSVLLDVQNGIDSPGLKSMANGAIRKLDRARAAMAASDGGNHDSAKVRSEPFVCRCAGEEGLLCKTWCGDRGCK